MKHILTNKANFKQMTHGAGAGLLAGSLGFLFSQIFETPETIKQMFGDFEYIPSNPDLAHDLMELKKLLDINGRPKDNEYFFQLCTLMNVLAGYDLVIDCGRPLSFELNYTLQHLSALSHDLLSNILKQNFRIVSMGASVCTLVDHLQETIKNIQYNMHQELQVRLMKGDLQ